MAFLDLDFAIEVRTDDFMLADEFQNFEGMLIQPGVGFPLYAPLHLFNLMPEHEETDDSDQKAK